MEDRRAALFESAKSLFAVKGFKDTNIVDITKSAGVAVGTFYNYYPSKESLFMDIFRQENTRTMRDIMQRVDLDEEPALLIKKLLLLNTEEAQKNPILSQWYNPDVYIRIEALYREENGVETADFLYGDFIRLLHKWQAEGKIRRDIKSGMIMAMFGAIIRIGFHKEEIGPEHFPELQDYLTEFVLKGLTDVKKGFAIPEGVIEPLAEK